jgi:hypothetical protein
VCVQQHKAWAFQPGHAPWAVMCTSCQCELCVCSTGTGRQPIQSKCKSSEWAQPRGSKNKRGLRLENTYYPCISPWLSVPKLGLCSCTSHLSRLVTFCTRTSRLHVQRAKLNMLEAENLCSRTLSIVVCCLTPLRQPGLRIMISSAGNVQYIARAAGCELTFPSKQTTSKLLFLFPLRP